MKFDITGRAGGKTYRALTWLLQHPDGVVLVVDALQKDNFCDAAEQRWGEVPCTLLKVRERVVTINSLHQLRGMRTQICIDNLDMVLRALLHGLDINYVTATGETRNAYGQYVSEHEVPLGYLHDDVGESHRRVKLVELDDEGGEAT